MKKDNIIFILIFLFLISFLQPINGTHLGGPLKNNCAILNQQNMTDVPTWCLDDTWMYEAHIYSDTEDGLFDISSDDLKLIIRDIKTIDHQNKSECIYDVHIYGNISGEFQSSILSGDITGIIQGNLSMRQADLSLLTSNVTSSGIIEYLIFLESDYEITSCAEYFPSFEYFDFPIKTNEEWNISTTAHQNSSFYVEDFFDNASESTNSMNGYAECLEYTTITVPAGTFSSYHLISQQENSSIESWYAPDTKNVVKLFMDSSNETETSKIWMNLTSYTLCDQQVEISASYDPFEVNVSEPVTIYGYVNETNSGNPLQNKDITIEIPYTNTSFNVTTNDLGYYSHTFIAPLILDSTNTSYDIGSDGIIITVNTSSYYGYRIATLIVIGIAIDNVEAHPPVQYETLGVNLTCNIYSVENISQKTVFISGPPAFGMLNTSLQSAENDVYYYNQTYSIIGNYSFYMWTNDSVGNSNKSDIYNFSIIPDTIKPEINDITVNPNPQYENLTVNISCHVTDNVEVDNVNIIITDTLNNEYNYSMIKSDNIYFFTDSYTITGNYSFYIWANDTLGNSNTSSSYQFSIISEIPRIKNVTASPNPQTVNNSVNISCDIIDFNGIDVVNITITGPNGFSSINTSMTQFNTTRFYYKTNYSIMGSYQYFIWVLDTDGNTNTSSLFFFDIINQSIKFNISLLPGWNLITVPVYTSWNASDIANNITSCNSLSNWDAINQTYNTYIVGIPESDFSLENGSGYFVDVDDACVLNTSGERISSVNISLEIGWNLIGWYHNYNTTASSLAENISGCNSVSSWDATAQTYNTHIAGVPESDFMISRGMGMFVDVDQQSYWHGEG